MLRKLGSFVLVLAVVVQFWLAGWPGPLEIATFLVLCGWIVYIWRTDGDAERGVGGDTSWSSHDGGGGGYDGGGGGD